MNEHPIEGLMITAMNSIRDMIDVNTIIGDPIEAPSNIIIIPISKVSFGFAAGGSEFTGETIDKYSKVDKEEQINYKLPFGGGAGAGVSINPIAFIVINKENVKLIPVNHTSAIDKLLDYVPDLIEKTSNMIKKSLCEKKDENKKVIKNIKKPEVKSTTKPDEIENQIEEQIDFDDLADD
ncbi:MAG: GerW family sporulation protein [Clostridia bacterium]|nr:GerW family sporulation protein [Clostridia bacterium]